MNDTDHFQPDMPSQKRLVVGIKWGKSQSKLPGAQKEDGISPHMKYYWCWHDTESTKKSALKSLE